jgi:hypothetical protein
VLAFIHIPKCAGTTLNSIIEQNYRKGEVARFTCRRMQDLTDEQRHILAQGFPGARVVRGHMVYGIHRYLKQEVTYFSIVRHPVDRVISNYFYAKELPTHQLYQRINSENLSLLDFATKGLSPGLDNGQTRYLSGFGNPIIGPKQRAPCPAEMLDVAKANAEMFALIGTTQRFDEFAVLAGERFGWRKLNYLSRNVRNHRPKQADYPQSVLDAIAEQNPLDMQLYARLHERFEAVVAGRRELLDVRIPQLRAENARRKRLVEAYESLRGLFSRKQ